MADDLPREIGRAKMQLGPLEIEVVNLDNGQRIVTQESMAAFLAWLQNGEVRDALRNCKFEDDDA
jgi:hypothetical protein